MKRRRIVVVAAVLAAVAAPLAFSLSYEHLGLGLRRRAWVEAHLVLPWFRPRCRTSNEIATIATLRNVCSSQAQFQATGLADEDHDGIGQFGGFLELSGGAPVRGRTERLDPPVLSGVFRTLNGGGEASRSGYLFRIWLVAADGTWIGETPRGFSLGAADAEETESRWRCVAWPVAYDRTGHRSFVTDESGEIFATDDERFSGPGAGPPPGDADARPSDGAATFTGASGAAWTRVN